MRFSVRTNLPAKHKIRRMHSPPQFTQLFAYSGVCVCVCVCVYMCTYACVCVRACMNDAAEYACARARVCVYVCVCMCIRGFVTLHLCLCVCVSFSLQIKSGTQQKKKKKKKTHKRTDFLPQRPPPPHNPSPLIPRPITTGDLNNMSSLPDKRHL